ncbi:hypothetical protein C8Q78DRAFT_1078950 [Trametes maxima]|nr:hypothetical protein C8Q78DRAFT_1078950 [Trametes maxima]
MASTETSVDPQMVSHPSPSIRKVGSGSGPWNTPVSITENSSQTFGFSENDAQARYLRLGKETMDLTVGPMPVTQFLEDFLFASCISKIGMPSPEKAFDKLKGATSESVIYDLLIEAINPNNSGVMARFVRWDRSGLIATACFSVVKHPEHLCLFLWCFAHLNDAERGYDLSVDAATLNQAVRFRDAVRIHIKAQLGSDTDTETLRIALDTHYMPQYVTAIGSVGDRTLLVSRPMTTPLSIAGRSTRAYWAVELDPTDSSKDRVLVLKDTWRLVSHNNASRAREGDVLLRLHDLGVKNIPPVTVDQGDVLVKQPGSSGASVSQCTITASFIDQEWGYLVDWEQSCLKTMSYNDFTFQPSLSWQFVSEAVSSGSRSHRIEDDMESMFYVVLWCGFLIMPHNLQPLDLLHSLRVMFDGHSENAHGSSGGNGKLRNKADRRFTGAVKWGSLGMQSWIDTVCDYMSPLKPIP